MLSAPNLGGVSMVAQYSLGPLQSTKRKLRLFGLGMSYITFGQVVNFWVGFMNLVTKLLFVVVSIGTMWATFLSTKNLD